MCLGAPLLLVRTDAGITFQIGEDFVEESDAQVPVSGEEEAPHVGWVEYFDYFFHIGRTQNDHSQTHSPREGAFPARVFTADGKFGEVSEQPMDMDADPQGRIYLQKRTIKTHIM